MLVENIMDKKTISELRDYVLSRIIYFYEYYKNENISETSFSDWNVRDVIGHINSWIKFSEDKLESIKLNRPFNDVNGEAGVKQLNQNAYEKNKNETLENVINESKMILERYKNILDLYSEEELLSDKFPIGFTCELWKYMAMDLGLHPLTHIMYQYIKREDYDEFIEEVRCNKKHFMDFSNNDIKVYYFGELFENKSEKEKKLHELQCAIKNKGNKLVEEIIKINME